MSSWVFFKFKSSKELTKIPFDGTGITVFELKHEIINRFGLGDGKDFDLFVYDESTNEEYDDDTIVIPKLSTVLGSRRPAAKAGQGKASRYVSGRMPIHARRPDKSTTMMSAQAAIANARNDTEREAALFAAQDEVWRQAQAHMSHAKAVPMKGMKKPNMPEKPLPIGYICHRCNQKGHWIYDCPTNDDPNFVAKPKLKKTTGIPRTFLQKVEKTENEDEEDLKGYMVDADGNRVRVKTDTATWEKEQAKHKAAAQQKEAAEKEKQRLEELGLICPSCNDIFTSPMKTPCCSKTYCHQCISNELMDDLKLCPNCEEELTIDQLVPDMETALKVKAYRDEKSAADDKAKAAAQEADAAIMKAALEKAEQEKKEKEEREAKEREAKEKEIKDREKEREKVVVSVEPNPNPTDANSTDTPNDKAKSQSPARASSTDSAAKKRPADEELQNDRVPTAPAAMNTPEVPDMNAQFLADMEKLSKGDFSSMMNTSMGMGMPNAMAMNNPMMMGMPMMNPMMMGMPWGFQPGMNMNNMQNMPNMNNMSMANQPNWNQAQNQNKNFSNRGGYGGNFAQRGGGNFGNNSSSAATQVPQQPQQQQPPPQQQLPQGQEDEDSPYFRQPVNPHRHQRAKRMRPSEFTELGRQ